MNVVTLIGNLTDDPELRITANGTAVANFRLGVTDNPWRGSRFHTARRPWFN